MINELLKSIHIISEEKVETAPYNNCVKAQVIETYSKGKYRVKTSEQSEFNVYSLTLNQRYEKGDVVWVLIINNMFTKYRYILGFSDEAKMASPVLVSPNGTEYLLGVDDEGNLTTSKINKEEG